MKMEMEKAIYESEWIRDDERLEKWLKDASRQDVLTAVIYFNETQGDGVGFAKKILNYLNA